MGWLEGMVTGYQNRSHDIEREKMEEAVAANQREATVYQALLNSGDPEIRAMAATGMLQTTQPRKRAGGLKGWVGEMQSNAMYPKLLQYLQTPQVVGEDVDTQVTSPQAAGYLPTLPPTSAPAAQAATQTTTPGAAPPVKPAPLPGPPPAPPAGAVGAAPAPPQAAPPLALDDAGEVPASLAAPPPPPDIPQTQGIDLAARAALPPTGAAVQPESLRQTTRTPVMALPHAFPTAEDTAYAATRAKEQADYDNLVQVGRRAGQPNPEQWAAQLIASSKQRAQGVHEGDARQLPDGSWVQDLYDNTGRVISSIPAAGPKPTTRAFSKREEIAAEKFGKPGEDPAAVMRRLTPREHGIVLREEGILASEDKLRQAQMMANAPLTAQAKSQLIEQLNTKWETLRKPQREMERQLGLMEVGVRRYNQDPVGASQAVLVTFQKILDPTSVVRESEYARGAEGLPMMDRVQGMYDRLTKGGAGVPENELKAMAETARQFLTGMDAFNASERQRMEDRAAQNGIDPGYIFGGGVKQPAVGGPPPAPGAAGDPSAATGDKYENINGVLHKNGKPF